MNIAQQPTAPSPGAINPPPQKRATFRISQLLGSMLLLCSAFAACPSLAADDALPGFHENKVEFEINEHQGNVPGFSTNGETTLLSFSGLAFDTGSTARILARVENAQLLRIWALDGDGSRLVKLCHVTVPTPRRILDCSHDLQLDPGTYQLEIILNRHEYVGNGSPNIMVTGYTLTVNSSNTTPEQIVDNCNVAPPTGYRQYWCEDFHPNTTGSPDPNFWDYDVAGVRNNEAQCYTDNDQDNVRLETRSEGAATGSYLVLELKKEVGTTCPQDTTRPYDYTSGAIMTRIRQNGDYLVGKTLEQDGAKGMPFGIYEIRARIPSGRGTWPAVWLLGHKKWTPEDPNSLGWPEAGEIDIMEAVGYEEDAGTYRTHHTLHRSRAFQWPHQIVHATGRNASGLGMTNALPEPPSAKFRTYTLIWQPDSIQMLVDGNSTMKMQVANENGDLVYQTRDGFFREDVSDYGVGMDADSALGWPFSKELGNEFHLVLNLAYGGGWGGQRGLDDSIFEGSVEMLVDYVRVYVP